MQCILLPCPRARDGVAGVMNWASEMVRMAKPLLDTEVSIILLATILPLIYHHILR